MNVCRNSLVLGLSYALDILGKTNLSHSKSTAYLSAMISRNLGHSSEDTLDIYYTALLHDIGLGCYDSDKNEVYAVDMKKHCILGAEMVGKLPLPPKIPTGILYHHEFKNGSGPFNLKSFETPINSQIVCLADTFDGFFGKKGTYDHYLFLEIKEWLISVRHLFAGDILDAFSELAEKEFFLLDYFNRETRYTLAKCVNVADSVRYGTEDVEKFARCFAEVIDQRSPFTYQHSSSIADLARQAAISLGYNGETQSRMYIAGLLHDLGKMHVSTEILHKPGPLTADERFEMNKHAYFTRKILEHIEGLEDIVDIAANHHERIDGGGYPYGKKGTELGELERVMSICDVYQALTEERPYRQSLPQVKVWEIISGMANRQQLDPELVTKLKPVFSA